jgi:hypothetical protein
VIWTDRGGDTGSTSSLNTRKNLARIDFAIATAGRIVAIPEVGDLHHCYDRIAA